MPKELDLDYISNLKDKWRYHLLEKENPAFVENREEYENRRKMYADALDMIDQMKRKTSTGIMLYYLFKALESGSLEGYKNNYSKKNK